MILVSGFFAITWLPLNVYAGFSMFNKNVTGLQWCNYFIVFVAFFYTSTNPFIYATKYDPVRKVLKEMIPCKKPPPPPPSTDAPGTAPTQGLLRSRDCFS